MTTAHTLLDRLETLRQLSPERATVEFKSNLNDAEEIGRYISGLANVAALRDMNVPGWFGALKTTFRYAEGKQG